ncbi:MAG: serine hydrolase [Pseudonocardiaceae bacterium]|nr:serine hydrolase [Pseudonocardiaceae bacterium]
MRNTVRTITGGLCAALLAAGVLATQANAQQPPAPPDRAELAAALKAIPKAGTPGALAAVRDEAGRWRGTAGVRDIHGMQQPKPNGRFRIASISKTFTATLVLRLADEGKLALDDPVQEYLPGLLPYREPITVRQLLQHTSGMPRDLPLEHSWTSLPEVDTERFVHFDPEKVVELSTSQPLQFPPGTSWAYSNTGYTVLGLLVERLTGQPIERALRERITAPLGLRDTFLARDYPFLPGKAARGYEQLYDPSRGLTDVTTYNYSRFFGAGSMVSTARDLNRFFGALLRGELLSDGTLAQMKRTVPALDDKGDYAGFDYGLGLMRLPLDTVCAGATPSWGHGGDLPGFGSWSMHSETGERQITSTMTRDVTAGDAHTAHQTLLATEFCGHRPAPEADVASKPLSSITRTITLAPRTP